ncbi:MAG: hypothetical protein Q9214_003556 [Letrouitia sp. 1 TL-2023]
MPTPVLFGISIPTHEERPNSAVGLDACSLTTLKLRTSTSPRLSAVVFGPHKRSGSTRSREDEVILLIATMMKARPKTVQIVLKSNTAVDHLHQQGVGIGVVQHAECATTGVNQNHLVPAQDRKYGIPAERFMVDNVKTTTRAQMLALLHALGLARVTIKRGSPRCVRFQSVVVFSESSKVVQLVNHHIEHGPDSLQDVTSTNDRKMIKSVLAAVQRLSRHGLHVSIRVSSRGDRTGEKARKFARQKGRKACKSRHQLWLAQNISPV